MQSSAKVQPPVPTLPSRPLRILVNTSLGERAEALLRQGAAPHEVVISSGASTVLSSSVDSLEEYDIAFGQPAAASILASDRLRWVQLTSAGYTRYDTQEFRAAVEEAGIALSNSSSVYDEPCAEHLMAFILAGARQLPRALALHCSNAEPAWQSLRDGCRLLRGQRFLILGYGAIGARLIEMLAPWGVSITAYRRKARGDETVPIVAYEDLPTAFAEADHVVNILPDNAASQQFINEERFQQMKSGAHFYNIGRGITVDQEALAAALQSGKLAAAWLDVTDPEPLPQEHPLLALENCHITPHIGGGQGDEKEALVRHFLENFQRLLRGEALLDRVM